MIQKTGFGGSRELELLSKCSNQANTAQCVIETYWEHITSETETKKRQSFLQILFIWWGFQKT